MWQRFSLYDIRVIGHYLGVLIVFSALLMFVPLVTALVFREWDPAYRYLVSIGIMLIVGALLYFCRIQPGRLNRRQAFAVVGLAWLVLGFACSVPLYLSGHYAHYIDALFDGVSGLTTTGATLIVDLDHLSYADNMFRFVMHLIGGLGLIVVALALGIFGKGSSSALLESEARSEHVVPNVVQTTKFIGRITGWFILVATVIVTVMMLVSGIDPVRSVLQSFWISLSGFVTGGFTPMQQSILYYHSIPIEVVLMLLMVFGSVSFVLYGVIVKGNVHEFFEDLETRTTVVWIGAMTVVLIASMASSTLFSDLPALLRRGTFMIVSVFTTTGFSVLTTNQLATILTSGAFLTLALLMAVGGGAGSTSGGIKISRIGIIAKSIVSTIKQTVSPDSATVVVSYNHVGRRILSAGVVKEAMTIFILFVITYALGALVGIAHGYDAQQAIFESVAMTSNGGLTVGVASSGMPISLELFYIFQMWAGRLEFIALLALVVEFVVSCIPKRKAKLATNAMPEPPKHNPRLARSAAKREGGEE